MSKFDRVTNVRLCFYYVHLVDNIDHDSKYAWRYSMLIIVI